MENIKFNFEDLKVYQKDIEYVDLAYSISEKFPKTERFALSPQYTRAAVSIALNIAEGSGDTNAQFNRFLQIALGSVKESVVCSTIARSQSYIDKELEYSIRKKLEELSKMITSIQKYLKNNSTN
jgi:four helix bundle protein